jgi:TolB-like protein
MPRRLLFVTAAVVLFALALLGARYGGAQHDAIGVAPLTAPASEREWAAALHAQIVSRLSNASRLPVVDLARSSAKTRWRVEGRVDRSAEQYRVTMLLRDTRDGSVRWSDIFAGAPGDWVDAQSEMAQRMTEIIRYRLEGPAAGLPMRRQKLPPSRSMAR